MKKNNRVLVGMAAAALAGVAIGILVAPFSGKESRNKLRSKATDLTDQITDAINANTEALKGKAEEVTEKAKNVYQQAKGFVKSEINHLKKDAEETV